MTSQEKPTADHERLIAALERNFQRFFSLFGQASGGHLHETPHALWFETPIPSQPYNGVLRFHAEDETDDRIDALFDHFDERGVPFFWFVHPTARPDDLPKRLTKRGFAQAEVLSGMAASLNVLPEINPPPEDIVAREVIGSDQAYRFLEMVAWRWSVPRDALQYLMQMNRSWRLGEADAVVRCWIAWRGDLPIAKAVLLIDENVAGLYGVSTRPEARGMGLATLLTLEALHAAAQAGCTTAVLHSSTMAHELYARLGFRDIADFPVFAPPHGLHI